MISSRMHQTVFTHSSHPLEWRLNPISSSRLSLSVIVLGRIVFLHLLPFSPPLNHVEELHFLYETVSMTLE